MGATYQPRRIFLGRYRRRAASRLHDQRIGQLHRPIVHQLATRRQRNLGLPYPELEHPELEYPELEYPELEYPELAYPKLGLSADKELH
jgi:hypothetical protein